MDHKTAYGKYRAHKHSAKHRGIPFSITFDQWLMVWGDKLDHIGRRAGQYMMCRIADKGGYEMGNVFIGTPKRNAASRKAVRFNKLGKDHPHATPVLRRFAEDLEEINLGYSSIWN